mmetsp:Transcript_12505/g.15074  ORF Transcript_12505/g.15074 Transcript_12505/m.15074 type:complete len:86 (-) Transcript_12505:892-1149(-)
MSKVDIERPLPIEKDGIVEERRFQEQRICYGPLWTILSLLIVTIIVLLIVVLRNSTAIICEFPTFNSTNYNVTTNTTIVDWGGWE